MVQTMKTLIQVAAVLAGHFRGKLDGFRSRWKVSLRDVRSALGYSVGDVLQMVRVAELFEARKVLRGVVLVLFKDLLGLAGLTVLGGVFWGMDGMWCGMLAALVLALPHAEARSSLGDAKGAAADQKIAATLEGGITSRRI